MLNMRQKQALTGTIKKRYQKANKKTKGKILDELIATVDYNRSYARRILNSHQRIGKKKQHRNRDKIYDQQLLPYLRTLWVATDNICSKRLQPFIPELINILETQQELKLDETSKQKLLNISCSTIDRALLPIRRSYRLKGRSTTKPGTLLRSAIPIRTFADWSEKKPGFFEADLVAFCGESPCGDFVNVLDNTDVFTGWVTLEAFIGKAQSRVYPAVDSIRQRLPFVLLGLDSDNGSEFINGLLVRYCQQHKITFTRSRAYRKNDNCYVEQKNYSVVRRFLGYSRYDTEKELFLVKEILKLVEIYVNFFQPSVKLISKTRINNKSKKIYDIAKTPYRRLLESGILSQLSKDNLNQIYHSLNPMELRRKISQLNQKLNQVNRYKLVESTNS
jgi:hypothetical protein